jgi:hypothetical protein
MKTKQTAAERAANRFRTGRPKLPKGEKRTAIVNVRMTPSERAAITAAAAKTGETLSQVLMRPWRKKGG